ncbi:hypothetical protein ACQKO5_22460, partial [Novosphingobium subterraneum]
SFGITAEVMLDEGSPLGAIALGRYLGRDTVVEAVQRYLAAHGLDARRQHLPASGRSEASVIAEYAENEGVDFLVAGGRAQGRWKERVFGGVTQDLLKTDITWVLAN